MQLRQAKRLILLSLAAVVLVVLPAYFQNQRTSERASDSYIGSKDVSKKTEASELGSPSVSPPAPKPNNPAESRASAASADSSHKTKSSNEGITAAVPSKETVPKQDFRSQAPPAALPSEESIQQQMERLAKALFFHNIPSQMRAGNSYTIEAGVAEKFTEELRQQLQGQGAITLRENVRYDPQGIDIQLKVNPNDFRVKELAVGKRPPIVNGKSNVWKWEVTPLRQGKRNLTLISVVDINAPDLGRSYVTEFTLHKEMVDVQVNPGYSIQQFAVKNWLSVLISVLAVLVGGFAWWKALQLRRGKDEVQYPQP